jgi:hypothetical protein
MTVVTLENCDTCTQSRLEGLCFQIQEPTQSSPGHVTQDNLRFQLYRILRLLRVKKLVLE